MIVDRRLALTAAAGLALILAAAVSDFITGSFWEHHALLASLLANMLVVGVTLIVVNEVLERRDRRRWNLLAQSVLFALLQTARATWMGLVEVLRLVEVQSGAAEGLRSAAEVGRDSDRVSGAVRELLRDDERRARLQQICVGLSEHASEVIARWAPVMVGASAYAEVLDRHVELAGRLEWLSNVLVHNDPPPGRSRHDVRLSRSNVATEHADELGNDDWLHDQILAVIRLATDLDEESREHAYSLVPLDWWTESTVPLDSDESVQAPPA
ncbi:MAG TPA: hypothetical protein VF380_05815 [Solirubrobacteraceae bacterium]